MAEKPAGQTPSQTVGPFFAYGLTPEQYGYPFASIARRPDGRRGERIRIVGQVLDGEGAAIADALIEFWQADAQGRYAHPADAGAANRMFPASAARAPAPTRKTASSSTPSTLPGAPHQRHRVHARPSQPRLYAHLFFRRGRSQRPRSGAQFGARGPAPDADRQRRGRPGAVYRFDIRMQGEAETVFFDV
jgi:protocatechuate 3,4-dioxygenase, alpha subunit